MIFFRYCLISLFVSSIGICACTYQNHKEVFTEIEIKESDQPFVELNFLNEELRVKEQVDLIFRLSNDKSGDGFVEYTFSFDGHEYTRQGDGSNVAVFTITPANFEYGYSTNLRFKGIVKSATKSLAARLDAEFYILQGSWSVVIDAKKAETITPEFKFENGHLAVFWDKASTDIHHSYILHEEWVGLYGSKVHRSFTFQDGEDLLYKDDHFNGNLKKFWIEMKSNWYSQTGDTLYVNHDPFNTSYYSLGSSHVVLKWDSIPFYNSDLDFSISYHNTEVEDLNLYSDSLLIYHPEFTDNPDLELTMSLSGSQEPNSRLITISNPSQYELEPGVNFKTRNQLFYNEAKDKILVISGSYSNSIISEYDPNTFTKLGEYPIFGGDYYNPPNSNVIYQFTNHYSSRVFFNVLDMSDNYAIHEFNFSEMLPTEVLAGGGVQVGSSNRIIFTVHPMSNQIREYAQIYNFETNTIEHTDTLEMLILSPFGKFAYRKKENELLRLENDDWIPVGTIELIGGLLGYQLWINDNGMEKLFLFDNDRVELYEWDDATPDYFTVPLAKIFPVPGWLNEPYFDDQSGLIGGYFRRNELYDQNVVLDPSDLSIVYEMDFDNSIPVKFIKNRFYIGNGHIWEPKP